MKKQKKSKLFRKVQRIIQNTYMSIFIMWSLIFVLAVKYVDFEILKPMLIVIAITGALTIGKLITHYRTNPKRFWKEVEETFKSEKGINF